MKSRVLNTSIVGGLTGVVVIFLVMLGSVPKSSAIPAFSRKYQTSCTTCHNNYPELNDFGEAFKKNGFKFPKDDETFVKEPPVLLGSKAQKEAFPGAVYPGEIPGFLPIAFRYEGNFTLNRKQPPGFIALNGFTPRTDLFAPNTFTIISAGSFGQNLSFWIDDDISVDAANANGAMGDGWLKYSDLGHGIGLPKNALNVRFGQFELDLPFTQAKSIYLSPYDIYNEANVAGSLGTTNNPVIFGSPQRGIEFGGTPNNGNFNWSVAIVNGNNQGVINGNPAGDVVRSSKDVYIRLSQKFNLERDPESRNAIQAAGPTGPRDHTSVRVGFYYYYGKNQQNQTGTTFPGIATTVEEPFYRVGADLRFKYRHLELFGLGMFGHDDNHLFTPGPPATIAVAPAVKFSGGFAGANYWFHPWLIGTFHYDAVNSHADFVNSPLPLNYHTRNRFSPGFQVLARANIKVVGEYQYTFGSPYTDPVTGNTLFFRPNTFQAGIDYVF
ncbi:MAG TPA: hypothetical protein VGR55_10695 [Candidatus Acidoferrum sp.]|nr:hypothetical protein [Candidatus Acidoferrum sp.]